MTYYLNIKMCNDFITAILSCVFCDCMQGPSTFKQMTESINFFITMFNLAQLQNMTTGKSGINYTTTSIYPLPSTQYLTLINSSTLKMVRQI